MTRHPAKPYHRDRGDLEDQIKSAIRRRRAAQDETVKITKPSKEKKCQSA